jgi:uncharacterized radical SAM protein YgiQ
MARTRSRPLKPRRGPAAVSGFLPTSAQDLAARGWQAVDVLIVTGDAYVDHPAFGPVVIARWLEARGYRVGLVAQPRWDSVDDIARLGRPRLFVGVSAGNLDSMLCKLTAQRKVRSDDPYSRGGRPGSRPNRASVVYANLCRRAFPGLPIVLGGIEASLRRIAHYDYWSDRVRRSVLLDAKADLLVFGMGERAAAEIAARLDRGEAVQDIRDVAGTAYVLSRRDWEPLVGRDHDARSRNRVVMLPSFEEVREGGAAFVKMTRLTSGENSPHNGRPLLQPHGDQAVFINPPAAGLDAEDLDRLYALPFRRAAHPSNEPDGVPALGTVEQSVSIMRGCFGGCAFCSIVEHEGRDVQSRSAESVLGEIRRIVERPSFSGVISDLGGPTANFYGMGCSDAKTRAVCRRRSCVHPKRCSRLRADATPYVELLRRARRERGVERVLVASGIRHDVAERSPELVAELAAHHTGGHLSVAPEHCVPEVLSRMRKPAIGSYEKFAAAFDRASRRAKKEQYLTPYFMVGHPGSTLSDALALGLYLKRRGMRPRQVQEFIPTPMTLATCMYLTGVDPLRGEPVPVTRDLREKRLMKALLFWWDPAQWKLAREALRKLGRVDLIGHRSEHLVPPARSGRRVEQRGRPRRLRRAPR